MSSLYNLAVSLATDPKHTRWIAPLLILAEAVLCFLILAYVPYTEIDYSTYLAQVHKFLQHGERKYTNIEGPTGPLVYPAVHVWIYSAFYYLTTTRDARGEIVEIDVPRAQLVFAGLYLVTLALVVACYRRVNAPPWLLAPLVLSKRLHSIFLLRLFNDGWATFFLWLTIYAMSRRYWHLSAITWAAGVGVKMTVLLAAPAVAIIIVQGMELIDAAYMAFASFGLHVITAVPFVEAAKGGDFVAYITRAFQLNRQFLFKWTANWRFVGEKTFLSREFAVSLLIIHVSLLATFIQTKWIRLTSSGVLDFTKKFTKYISRQDRERIGKLQTPTYVMDTMLGAMLIGLLCARTLHYQFYAYIGWATPYILWRGTGSMILTLGICAVQEWSWLVFPSTDASSMILVACLALQVVCALIAQPVDGIAPPEIAVQKLQERIDAAEDEKST